MNCKHCGTPLLQKATKQTPERLTKSYYYTAYYVCPNCRKMYHDDKFKVMNTRESLFTKQVLDTKDIDIHIWTDGACRGNGTPHAIAAWAFVSGKHEESGLVEGKQTNNTAEAFAIYYGLHWAVKEKHKNIKLYTDSQISIQSLTKPVHKVVANREIFEKIQNLIQDNDLKVQYEKVAGHADDVNNNRADKLANTLAGIF